MGGTAWAGLITRGSRCARAAVSFFRIGRSPFTYPPFNLDDEFDEQAVAEAANDLERFFGALPLAARREYELLAKRDLEFGEDVAAELRGCSSKEGG